MLGPREVDLNHRPPVPATSNRHLFPDLPDVVIDGGGDDDGATTKYLSHFALTLLRH